MKKMLKDKKKNLPKLGFTLVELLAVIVILALILSIAIPSITSLIENARINAYIQNEEMMLRAAKNYITLNEEELPNEIGETKGIILEQLQTGEYISVIKDPNDKNEECNGYVLITKTSENNYDYTPHLKCGDSRHIDTIEEDGLVLHYKFDDFQEPTENLFSIEGVDVKFLHEIEERRIWRTTGSTSMNTYSTNRSNGVYGRIRDLDDNPYNIRIQYVEFSPNTVYTFSVIGASSSSASGFRVFYTDGSFDDMTFINDNVFREILFTSDLNKDVQYIAIRSGFYDIDTFQIEAKEYKTPFVDGVREGIITDYSMNDNHVPLVLNKTPRWVNNSNVGKGAYYFNGENNYIKVSDINVGGSMTTSYWIKPFKYERVTGGLDSRGNNSHQIRVYSNTQLRPRLYDAEGTWFDFTLRHDTSSLMGKWQHHVLVFDSDTKIAKLFVNGEKVLKQQFSNYVVGTGQADFVIGSQNNHLNQDYVEGYYDDVRIYSRALSDEEIMLLYNSSK